VDLVSTKADTRFGIYFVTLELLKKINWYISLHVIHNTLPVFIMTAHTVRKK